MFRTTTHRTMLPVPVRLPLLLVTLVMALVLAPKQARAQAGIAAFTGRPFVTSVTPVIGPGGGVGGIEVNADGLVTTAEIAASPELDLARQKAIAGVSQDVFRRSAMRKVSLSRLEQASSANAASGKPIPIDMMYLAGLQRIEYVLAYPDLHDVVIAGPAEGWHWHQDVAVGASSRRAVLRLDDLLDALQSREAAAAGGGITCSIDPTESGAANLQRFLRRRHRKVNRTLLRTAERQLGRQTITLTGIRPNGHFAGVLVSADYRMKLLAMGLDESPVTGLPSYVQLLGQQSESAYALSPRFWITPDYSTLEHSSDRLSWRIPSRGVQAKSEQSLRGAGGKLQSTSTTSAAARAWTESFTTSYDELSTELPVFDELGGCIDLAVLAALLAREDLLHQCQCPLLTFTDSSKLSGPEYHVPTSVDSLANAIRGRQGWIVSVSGGVDLETATVLSKATVEPELDRVRAEAGHRNQHWWWD